MGVKSLAVIHSNEETSCNIVASPWLIGLLLIWVVCGLGEHFNSVANIDGERKEGDRDLN